MVVGWLLFVVGLGLVVGQDPSCEAPPCDSSCYFHGTCNEITGTCECFFGYAGSFFLFFSFLFFSFLFFSFLFFSFILFSFLFFSFLFFSQSQILALKMVCE